MPESEFIFISHVEEDKEIALKVADGLEKAGYNTWYYERDSLEYGAIDYLELLANAVMDCSALALIISPNSIDSDKVNKEVICASEENKKFIPLLHNISPAEFRKKRKWAFLFGGLNLVEITLSDIESKFSLILNGLKKIGIQPNPNRTDKINPKEIIGKDGAEMVLIPAGEFQMGSNDYDDEKPIHIVYLDAFYIDKYEVTNAQYRKFMDATGQKVPSYWSDSNFNAPNQPVVGVSWNDAKAYADWAGKRLPTEAEWEKAARGGLVGKKYVWGDEWPPPKGAGNFADESTKKIFPNWTIIDGYDDGYAYTSPVGSFNLNGYGLYDMAGNVWELCADWYDNNYYASSPNPNPTGPSSGNYHVCRGGSWLYSLAYGLRVSTRNDYYADTSDVGFRCVR